MTNPPLRSVSALPNDLELDKLALRYVQNVCEWDDRTSPEDWPEALLITGDELHQLLKEFAADFTTLKASTFNEAEKPSSGFSQKGSSVESGREDAVIPALSQQVEQRVLFIEFEGKVPTAAVYQEDGREVMRCSIRDYQAPSQQVEVIPRIIDPGAFDWGEALTASQEVERLREALGLFMAAKAGIAADSYDGIEERYVALLEEAGSRARALGINCDLPAALASTPSPVSGAKEPEPQEPDERSGWRAAKNGVGKSECRFKDADRRVRWERGHDAWRAFVRNGRVQSPAQASPVSDQEVGG